jgi:ferritin
MLSDSLKKALNEQIAAEMYSSYLYLALSYEFCHKNLNGFGHWFKCQAHEEMHHAHKIAEHLIMEKASVLLKGLNAPNITWKRPIDAFEIALKHERMISERIRSIMSIARKEADFSVENLMLWFVDEQVEEENSVENIYQKLDMIGNDGSGIIFLDKELGKRNHTNK